MCVGDQVWYGVKAGGISCRVGISPILYYGKANEIGSKVIRSTAGKKLANFMHFLFSYLQSLFWRGIIMGKEG
jgi:hypothetical protein